MARNSQKVKTAFDKAEDVTSFVWDGHSPSQQSESGDIVAKNGTQFPLNDTGNGQRLALYFGEYAIFFPRIGWHIWDGFRWKLDPDSLEVRRYAQLIQTKIIEEIKYIPLGKKQLAQLLREDILKKKLDKASLDDDIAIEEIKKELHQIKKIKELKQALEADRRRFAKSAGNKSRIDGMLVEATTILGRDIKNMDSDPLSVNTESGVLQFSVSAGNEGGCSPTADFKLKKHAREMDSSTGYEPKQKSSRKLKKNKQYITKCMPVVYDPKAKCPKFDAFLKRIQPQAEMRAFLQRWWGLSMTALPVQKFMFQYGQGANGKSVLCSIIERILGDYAASVKIESITGHNRRGGGDATPDLMVLVGSRCAITSEPDEGQRLQEGMIKQMTGGEPILVRKLHDDFIQVTPYFKLVISGNHKPDIRGTDDGIWRRVLLVPFDVSIPEKERDENLIEKLWDERSGILNWLIDGLLDYLERGFAEPAPVLEATSNYREESNPVGTYLQECCIVTGDNKDFITARDLINGFNLWQAMVGGGTWGDRTISLRLKSEASRYRDPQNDCVFSWSRRQSSGYVGICFTKEFQTTYDEAPRNAKGQPVMGSKSQQSSGYSDMDFPV